MKINVLSTKSYDSNRFVYRHRCAECSSLLQIDVSENIPDKIRCPICGNLMNKTCFVKIQFMDADYWDTTPYEV